MAAKLLFEDAHKMVYEETLVSGTFGIDTAVDHSKVLRIKEYWTYFHHLMPLFTINFAINKETTSQNGDYVHGIAQLYK